MSYEDSYPRKRTVENVFWDAYYRITDERTSPGNFKFSLYKEDFAADPSGAEEYAAAVVKNLRRYLFGGMLPCEDDQIVEWNEDYIERALLGDAHETAYDDFEAFFNPHDDEEDDEEYE